jgi:spermidine synthase
MNFEQLNKTFNTEFTNRLYEKWHIFYEIYEACKNEFTKGCGSYLFDGTTYKYCPLMYEKQELLYNCAKKAKNVLEIGSYVGHSLFIMLLANPDLKITCIDIEDQFTKPAVDVLNKHFNNAIRFIHADSLTALDSLQERYDFFHVDGYHEDTYITKEFLKLKTMNNNPDNIMRILFDDEGCLRPLQNFIFMNHHVLNVVKPRCPWANVYFEIQL